MAHRNVLFRGFSDIDQIHTIFRLLGTPTAEEWPGLESVPYWRGTYPSWPARHMHAFLPRMGSDGIDFMSKILCYDPKLRMSARAALQHPFISGAEEVPVTPRTPVHFSDTTSSASVTRVVSQESCADLQALDLMAAQQANLLHRAPPMSRCSSVLEGAVVTAMDEAAGVTSAAATFQPICSGGPSGLRPSGAQAATLAAQTGTALTVPAPSAAAAALPTVALALPQPNRAGKGQIALSNPRVMVPVVSVAELKQQSQSQSQSQLLVPAVVTQSSQGESQASSARSGSESVPPLGLPSAEMLSEEHVKLATQRSAYQAIFASQQQVVKATLPVRASRRTSSQESAAVVPAAAKRKVEGDAAVLMEPRPRSRLGKTMNFASPDAVATTNTTAAPSVEAIGTISVTAAAFATESSAAGGVWGPPPTKKMRSSKQQQQSAAEAGRSVSRLRVGSEDSQTSGMSFVSSLDLDLESSMEVTSDVSMDAGVAAPLEEAQAVAVPDPSSALQQPTGAGKTRFYKRKFGAVSSTGATVVSTVNPIGSSSVPRASRSTAVFVRVTPEAAPTTNDFNKAELYWTGSTPDFLSQGPDNSGEVKVPVVGGEQVSSDIKDDAKQGRSRKSICSAKKGKEDKSMVAEAAVAATATATAPVTRRSARIVQ